MIEHELFAFANWRLGVLTSASGRPRVWRDRWELLGLVTGVFTAPLARGMRSGCILDSSAVCTIVEGIYLPFLA